MGIKDAELLVRSPTAGALTSDNFTSSLFSFIGTHPPGYVLEVQVPSYSGTSPTLKIYIHGATATAVTTASMLLGTIQATLTSANATGLHFIPFNLPADVFYVKVFGQTTGTTPDFGAVQMWFTQAGAQLRSRGKAGFGATAQ